MIMVSIVIPCYNQGDYVADAIRSVIEQDYDRWECIIVNDGSTDQSKEVILSSIEGDDRFKYLEQENKGVGYSRNRGASVANGKYLTMLDADDMIGKDYLRNAVEYLEENPRCVLYYGKVRHIFEDGGVIFKETINKPSCRQYWDLFSMNQLNTTCVYKKSDYDKIGGFNEELDNKEDWEFYLRLLYRNRPFFISDVEAFTYRHHEVHRDKPEYTDLYFKKIMDLNPIICDDFKRTILGTH